MSHGGRCAPELLPLTPRQCRVVGVQADVSGGGVVPLHAAGLITRPSLLQTPIAYLGAEGLQLRTLIL